MRIDVFFTDRVGIAQEILATLAQRALDVSAVEVEPPHVYLEAPALDAQGLEQLRGELLGVAGVQSVGAVAMLPGARRRLYLDALLAAQEDPVLAVDAAGVVVVANAAAVSASGLAESALIGRALPGLTDRTDAPRAGSEVQFGGQPFLLESVALHEAGVRWPARC